MQVEVNNVWGSRSSFQKSLEATLFDGESMTSHYVLAICYYRHSNYTWQHRGFCLFWQLPVILVCSFILHVQLLTCCCTIGAIQYCESHSLYYPSL